MTRAPAKKIAYGWCADVLLNALSAGGIEGQALSRDDEDRMQAAITDIAESLRKRGLPPEPK